MIERFARLEGIDAYTILFIGDPSVLEGDGGRPKPDETVEKEISTRWPHHGQGEERQIGQVGEEVRIEFGDRCCPQHLDFFQMTHRFLIARRVAGDTLLLVEETTWESRSHPMENTVLKRRSRGHRR